MDRRRIIEDAHPLIIASIKKYAIWKDEFEDLYQEGALKILELLEEYDDEKGVDIFYYLKLHLRFFYLNYARYEKDLLSLNTSCGDGVSFEETLVDDGASVQDMILEKMNNESLYKLIENLEDEESYIIKQLYFERKTLDTLSKELGISKSKLFRKKDKILKAFREIL